MNLSLKNLSKPEVLRYLGYRGTVIPLALDQLIDQCIDEVLQTVQPQYIYRKFAICHTDDGVQIEQTPILLTGNSIREHLLHCNEIYLLAVTIGIQADRMIRKKMATAPDEGVICNSAFGVAIEQVADLADEQIQQECAKDGKNTTWRFSPGYGDLPLTPQKQIIQVLQTQQAIGLTVTDSLILTPTKSVTAIIGVTDARKDPRSNKCDYCANRERCQFRKSGKQC